MVYEGQRSCSIVNPQFTIKNPQSARRAAASFQITNYKTAGYDITRIHRKNARQTYIMQFVRQFAKTTLCRLLTMI